MSDKKFTPGPWVVYEPDDCHGLQDDDSLVVGMGDYIESPNHYACIHKIEISCAYECEEGTANAHLIAAAPEMYRMLDVLSRKLPDEMTAEYYEIIGLLSKARGE